MAPQYSHIALALLSPEHESAEDIRTKAGVSGFFLNRIHTLPSAVGAFLLPKKDRMSGVDKVYIA